MARGLNTGTFNTWAEAKEATEGFPNADQRKFLNHRDARRYVESGGRDGATRADRRSSHIDRKSQHVHTPMEKVFWTVRGVAGEGVYDTMVSMLEVLKSYPNAEWKRFRTYEEAFEWLAELHLNQVPSSTNSSDVPSDRGGWDNQNQQPHRSERLQRYPTS